MICLLFDESPRLLRFVVSVRRPPTVTDLQDDYSAGRALALAVTPAMLAGLWFGRERALRLAVLAHPTATIGVSLDQSA
jgi:hypothetical protein